MRIIPISGKSIYIHEYEIGICKIEFKFGARFHLPKEQSSVTYIILAFKINRT